MVFFNLNIKALFSLSITKKEFPITNQNSRIKSLLLLLHRCNIVSVDGQCLAVLKLQSDLAFRTVGYCSSGIKAVFQMNDIYGLCIDC